MTIYLLKTEFPYGEDSKTVGLFTDLEPLKEAILCAADSLWGDEYVSPYDSCKSRWFMEEDDCDHQCEGCSEYQTQEEYLEELRREREQRLYPQENVYVEAWEANAAGTFDEDGYLIDVEKVCTSYKLRPSSPEDNGRFIRELYGEEIYHYVLPKALEDLDD